MAFWFPFGVSLKPIVQTFFERGSLKKDTPRCTLPSLRCHGTKKGSLSNMDFQVSNCHARGRVFGLVGIGSHPCIPGPAPSCSQPPRCFWPRLSQLSARECMGEAIIWKSSGKRKAPGTGAKGHPVTIGLSSWRRQRNLKALVIG